MFLVRPFVMLVALTATSHGSPIFSWRFDVPSGTAADDAVLSLPITISNDPSSTDSITSVTTILPGLGEFAAYYNFVPGNVFGSIHLAAGESAQRVFGTLTPKTIPVPFGTYSTAPFPSNPAILFNGPAIGQGGIFVNSSNAFTRSLVPEPSVVPEPSTWFMLLTGGFGIAVKLRRHPHPDQ